LNFHQNSKNKENTSDNLRGFLNKKYLKDIAKKLNMKQTLNFQMARHTCFSNLQRSGANFSEIMEISGHARVESLRNYLAALKPKDMKKVVDKL
jgi:integrase